MTEDNDLMPFNQWLAQIDRPTAEYIGRGEGHTLLEREAFCRGQFTGQWMALHDLYRFLQSGVTNGETLAGMLAAGLTALKDRRTPRDFRLALERHMQSPPRVIDEQPPAHTDDDDRERAIDEENGGPDD